MEMNDVAVETFAGIDIAKETLEAHIDTGEKSLHVA